MVIAPFPPDEDARLRALHSLRLLDTPPEERFDAITRLAARVFDVPTAFVSLLDRERQWLKARVGFEVCETSRDVSFCSHTILQDAPLVIADTLADPRFAGNPLVTGEPFVRFYAGLPLRAQGGEKIGTLCIADSRPHDFPADRLTMLRELGSLAERELQMTDLMDAQTNLLTAQAQLLSIRHRLEDELAAAERYVKSLLPTPRETPARMDWRFLPSQTLGGDCLGYFDLEEGKLALFLLDVCGHGVGAALLSVALLSTLRSQALRGADFADPASVLKALNREFPMQRHENRFVTMWYGVLDAATGRLVYSGAGHPPAIVIETDGTARRLETQGIPIGCLPDAAYANGATSLKRGDALYLFSDGAFEIRQGANRLVPFEELETLFARAAGSLDAVVAELQAISRHAPFADDVTLLQMRVP